MAGVFEKLNLKGQAEILVINPPMSFESEISQLKGTRIIRNLEEALAVHFALAFTTKQAEVDYLTKVILPKAEGDALIWFAYPKGTSKTLKCEFNRDTGWDLIRANGFDSVRQVAIDNDWSALRFRRIEYIKPSTKK